MCVLLGWGAASHGGELRTNPGTTGRGHVAEKGETHRASFKMEGKEIILSSEPG